MSESTSQPWTCGPPLPLMNRPHDLLISGDRRFSHEEECQCDCDGGPEICNCEAGCGWSAATVCHVLGNETAGDIPKANAELIVRAVNSFDALVAALQKYVDHYGDPLKCARAALALADDSPVDTHDLGESGA